MAELVYLVHHPWVVAGILAAVVALMALARRVIAPPPTETPASGSGGGRLAVLCAIAGGVMYLIYRKPVVPKDAARRVAPVVKHITTVVHASGLSGTEITVIAVAAVLIAGAVAINYR